MMQVSKLFDTSKVVAWNLMCAAAAMPLLVLALSTRLMVSVSQWAIPRFPKSALKNYCAEMLISLTGRSNGSPSHTPKI